MGLGHIRRNALIAQGLVETAERAGDEPPIVLLISGNRQSGALPLPNGVDCVTLPSLRKGSDGRYRSRHLDLDLGDLISLRAGTIAGVLDSFEPDVFIVDKAPRGAVHELDPVLESLRRRGRTRLVLGLRDVLDEPSVVRREWIDDDSEETIDRYYDAIWVYGDSSVFDPVLAYDFSPSIAAKVRYTGYLDSQARVCRDASALNRAATFGSLGINPDSRLILCMVGGGQDGAELAEAFAQATFPNDSTGLLLTGPDMPLEAVDRLRNHAGFNLSLDGRLPLHRVGPSASLRRSRDRDGGLQHRLRRPLFRVSFVDRPARRASS